MKIYLQFLQHILAQGHNKPDRTGTGVFSTFGYQMRFDLQQGFPLVTTKKVHIKSVVHELLWFLKGDTNINYLNDHGVRIWNEWADEDGNLGPVYGKQWRSWQGYDGKAIDQLHNVIQAIKSDPNSRRLLVNAWNVADLPNMALPPCHMMFQFYVVNGVLSCHLYQRSVDGFLGLPFNIASYALLTHLVAHQCGMQVGEFVWTGGDCHIYHNHIEQVELQLTREPYPLPQLRLTRRPERIEDYCYEDIVIEGYHCHPTIKGAIAV